MKIKRTLDIEQVKTVIAEVLEQDLTFNQRSFLLHCYGINFKELSINERRLYWRICEYLEPVINCFKPFMDEDITLDSWRQADFLEKIIKRAAEIVRFKERNRHED